MNPIKFHQRTKLFNDLLYEIFNVESNYRTELSVLNLKLSRKIEDYKNKINQNIKQEKFRNTVNNTKPKIRHKNSNASVKPKLKTSKSKENIFSDFSDKEENPLIDQLLSDGLQQLLNFYKNKHKLISKEVSNLGIILYDYSSSRKKYDSNEDLATLEKYQNDFEINFSKIMIIKKNYFEKMNKLELLFHDQEEKNKKITKEQNNIKDNNKKENNKNNENKEKEKINELIHLREKYKKYANEITNNQRTFISKINEIGNDIQEFNITENNILFNIFKVFEELLTSLLKEVNSFCLLYDNNKKLIQELNIEMGNNIINDNRMFINYQFEEYSPKFTDINNPHDFSVIQKMNKLIGFEYDKMKTNNSSNNKINDNNYSNIDDNNILFILLMDKFTSGENLLNEKEKNLMKNLFNQEKYIKEFLNKLNKIRINKKIFNNKERFEILVDFFNFIYSKISFNDNKSHELVKFLMILSETFFYKEEDKKIFLNNVINLPPEIKNTKFWIKYIELEIEIEYKKYDSKKNMRYEYIVILSNTTHLKEYLVEKEKLNELIDHFIDKYKLSIDEIDVIKEQLKI